MLDDALYWSQQRHELFQWLEDRAPSFAEGYVGAVRLLHMPSFPARVHFICHVVRDIYRRLPVSLEIKSLSRPSDVLPDLVKALRERWDRFPPNDKRYSEKVNADIPVSPQVHSHILKIVDKSKEIASQPTVGKQLAMALFRSLERREDEFIQPWIIKSFDTEYDFFVKRAHLAESVKKVPTDDGLTEHFEAFERSFHSLVGPYFTGKEELDAILQDTNPAAD